MAGDAESLPRRRVLVLASKPKGLSPSQRFRLEQWAPRLKRDHGIELDFAPFESDQLAAILNKPGRSIEKAFRVAADFFRRAAILRRLNDYDAVVVHREAALIGPAIYERLIAATGTPLVFDFDDAIWMHQPGSSIVARLHFLGKIRTTIRKAAAVSAGNSYLADFARRYNPNVFVVPTTIELDDYPVVPEPTPDRPFIVSWSGSTSTLRHLIHARDAIERLAAKIPLVFKIICNEPPEWSVAGAEMQFVPWSRDAEALEIGRSHASIMPLPDDQFTRGKCGLKALQAMATGRPVVISPVGMNNELISEGENGFLAATANDYVARLLDLAHDPELRERVGANGRRTVEHQYSAAAGAAKFAEVVEFAIRQRKP